MYEHFQYLGNYLRQVDLKRKVTFLGFTVYKLADLLNSVSLQKRQVVSVVALKTIIIIRNRTHFDLGM